MAATSVESRGGAGRLLLPAMRRASTTTKGLELKPQKCSEMSVEERRSLVRELSQGSRGAPALLQSWSRRDLLELLCLEMGKERKYTGLTKFGIIENLLNVVSGKKKIKKIKKMTIKKKPGKPTGPSPPAAHPPPANLPPPPPPPSKRRRKNAHPRRLPLDSLGAGKICRNSACRAAMREEASFCRRCSCHLCQKFDENKDPSLWVVCGSEEQSCAASYHLECILKLEEDGHGGVDGGEGSFSCIYCGKLSDFLGCLRKQLSMARDARRVDALCYRLSLSRRILAGRQKLEHLRDAVESAARKLEAEIGVLEGSPANIGFGAVSGLSSGAEVQILCAAAVAAADCMISSSSSSSPAIQELGFPSISVNFEDASPTRQMVATDLRRELPPPPAGFALWCRKVEEAEFLPEPVVNVAEPERRLLVSGLDSATGFGEFGKRELWFTENGTGDREGDSLPESRSGESRRTLPEIPDLEEPPPPEEDEEEEEEASVHGGNGDAGQDIAASAALQCSSNSTGLDLNQALEPPRSDEESNEPPPPLAEGRGAAPPLYGRSDALPHAFTPSKKKPAEEKSGGEAWFGQPEKEPPCPGSSSKKKTRKTRKMAEGEVGLGLGLGLGSDYEYCVKMIRRLEREGHMETSFRVKFLTWFSLKASAKERRVVGVFVDAMADDLASLAGQLIDTFSDGIRRNPPPLAVGFCSKLWH